MDIQTIIAIIVAGVVVLAGLIGLINEEGTTINNCHVDTTSENALEATAHEAESKYNRAAQGTIVGSGSSNTITNSD